MGSWNARCILVWRAKRAAIRRTAGLLEISSVRISRYRLGIHISSEVEVVFPGAGGEPRTSTAWWGLICTLRSAQPSISPEDPQRRIWIWRIIDTMVRFCRNGCIRIVPSWCLRSIMFLRECWCLEGCLGGECMPASCGMCRLGFPPAIGSSACTITAKQTGFHWIQDYRHTLWGFF